MAISNIHHVYEFTIKFNVNITFEVNLGNDFNKIVVQFLIKHCNN